MDITSHQEQQRKKALAQQPASLPAANGAFDLLGQDDGDMGARQSEDQRSNPFNNSRQDSSQEVPTLSSPAPNKETDPSTPASAPAPRPRHFRSHTGHARLSLDTPSYLRSPATASSGRRRRFSLTLQRGLSRTATWDDDGEEGDGDLGFAAASGREGATRKVIVERIEVVKSKVPVFSWC